MFRLNFFLILSLLLGINFKAYSQTSSYHYNQAIKIRNTYIFIFIKGFVFYWISKNFSKLFQLSIFGAFASLIPA